MTATRSARSAISRSYLFRAVRLVVDFGPPPQEMEPRAGDPLHGRERRRARRQRHPRDRALFGLARPGLRLQDRPDGDRRACATRPSGGWAPRFDIKAFHDVVLLGGAMPLTGSSAASASGSPPEAAAASARFLPDAAGCRSTSAGRRRRRRPPPRRPPTGRRTRRAASSLMIALLADLAAEHPVRPRGVGEDQRHEHAPRPPA